MAVVVRPDTLRPRRADRSLAAAERVRDLLSRAASEPLAPAALTKRRAEELVAEVRAGRAAADRSAVDAFDADVLIYAATRGHDLGRRVRNLFPSEPAAGTGVTAGVGSLLLVPETLSKPIRDGRTDELDALASLLGRSTSAPSTTPPPTWPQLSGPPTSCGPPMLCIWRPR